VRVLPWNQLNGQNRQQQEDHPDGKKTVERISHDKIFKAIAEDLRNPYSIGYTPPADDATSYHRIHLTAKQKEIVVQAGDGYYGAK
jgi:hypothetical protein